jgi:hypothetical protein
MPARMCFSKTTITKADISNGLSTRKHTMLHNIISELKQIYSMTTKNCLLLIFAMWRKGKFRFIRYFFWLKGLKEKDGEKSLKQIK